MHFLFYQPHKICTQLPNELACDNQNMSGTVIQFKSRLRVNLLSFLCINRCYTPTRVVSFVLFRGLLAVNSQLENLLFSLKGNDNCLTPATKGDICHSVTYVYLSENQNFTENMSCLVSNKLPLSNKHKYVYIYFLPF